MLSVENLDVFYGDAQALDNIGIEIEQGAIVTIVGANGAGKSSLIRTIAGMHKPARGRIVYRGTDITGWPSHKVCDLGIGQVAEGRQVFPTLTVAENLAMGALVSRARAGRERNLDRIYAMFPVLAARRNQAAGTLSGGEQQMLAIGRCLMSEPELIMFDEPSLGLAPAIVQSVLTTVRDLPHGQLISLEALLSQGGKHGIAKASVFIVIFDRDDNPTHCSSRRDQLFAIDRLNAEQIEDTNRNTFFLELVVRG